MDKNNGKGTNILFRQFVQFLSLSMFFNDMENKKGSGFQCTADFCIDTESQFQGKGALLSDQINLHSLFFGNRHDSFGLFIADGAVIDEIFFS